MKLPAIAAIGIGILLSQPSFAAQTAGQPATQPNAAVHPTPLQPNSQPVALNTEQDKVSYSIGVDLGQNFKSQGIEINSALLAKGLQDGLSGQTPMLTKQQMVDTLMAFQKQLMTKRQAEFKGLAEKNKQEGTAFLAANKTKPGVVTTASGLQYKVIDAGKGVSPTDKDIVTVDYSGNFINGKVFDSSYERKQPATFPVSEVIPGWTEVLKLMKPGATYEIVVPSNLAYGERGFGNAIGPNETLLFKIHLISVKKQA